MTVDSSLPQTIPPAFCPHCIEPDQQGGHLSRNQANRTWAFLISILRSLPVLLRFFPHLANNASMHSQHVLSTLVLPFLCVCLGWFGGVELQERSVIPVHEVIESLSEQRHWNVDEFRILLGEIASLCSNANCIEQPSWWHRCPCGGVTNVYTQVDGCCGCESLPRPALGAPASSPLT